MLPILMMNEETLAQIPEDVRLYMRALRRRIVELEQTDPQQRIAELEALVEYYRDKSERAEDWLNQILTEIEDRLINEPKGKRLQIS